MTLRRTPRAAGERLELGNRRPIRSRQAGWAKASAAWLADRGVSPDAISAGAVVFALIGAGAFVGSGMAAGRVRAALLLAAAACIQGRLVCNLLDGLVAVEHGRGGPHGAIWNELPDRVADALLLAGAGYGAALAGSAWAIDAGWLAAVLAVLTAYVRELGRALGAPSDFSGPGAKPQRMGVLTAGALIAAMEPASGSRGATLGATLAIVAGLAAFTVVRRTLRLAAALDARTLDPRPEPRP